MDKKPQCIFCQIIEGNLPAKIVMKNKDFVVFEDINPKAPVHVLVVPRKHIGSVNEITVDDRELMAGVFEVIKVAAEKTGIKEAYQLRVNNGRGAGQIVDHLHVHVMGGWKKMQN